VHDEQIRSEVHAHEEKTTLLPTQLFRNRGINFPAGLGFEKGSGS
jgi:hypothetical protein